MTWFTSLLKTLPFANSAMLLWGLAAALPIIIHLWSKRKYNEMTWAAMEFLLAAVRKNARRIRIEQLILLAVRVSILVLLAMALADPVWNLFPSLGTSLGAGGDSHFVLVIDGSYSMDYKPGEKTRFQYARELASQVLENSRQGDGFTLLLMADPPEVVIAEPAFAPADILEELESLTLRHGGANLAATLASIEAVLQKAKETQPRLVHHNICFFSDLGQTTWGAVAADDIRSQIGRLADSSTIVMFDVGQPDAENLAISRLELRNSLVTLARGATIEAEVQNFGATEKVDQPIEFLVDGQVVQQDGITVSPNSPTTVSFEYQFTAPGEHRIEARLGDDLLAVDNHRWLSVPVREAIGVLCVEGQLGAARHVAIALQPETTDRPHIQVDVRTESALAEADLHRYDCLFLCNVARFSREEAGVLHDFVHDGGGLVIVLGDQVQPENYNQQLGAGEAKTRVLPARLETAAATAQYFFDPLQYRHPIVEPFRGFELSGLLTTPVWRYFKVERYDQATARIALAFQNGDPAIVEEAIGRGRTILLTTAASPLSVDRSTNPPTPWTAMSTWPSFPPLVQEMLRVAVQGRNQNRNVFVGESLDSVLHSSASGVSLSVVTPSGSRERVRMTSEGNDSRWVYGNTFWSGIYEARYGPPVNQLQHFAVNVDAQESDLQRFDPDLLPSQVQRDMALDQQPASVAATRPGQYFRYLLGGVLMLVLLETFLAWHFGNASA